MENTKHGRFGFCYMCHKTNTFYTEKLKHGDGSVMFWSCVADSGVGQS